MKDEHKFITSRDRISHIQSKTSKYRIINIVLNGCPRALDLCRRLETNSGCVKRLSSIEYSVNAQ